jgi:hypothetical protein
MGFQFMLPGIKAQTDTIPAVKAQTDTISAVKTKTDLIPAAGPPSATDYSAGRAAKIDNLDATISSRLATSSYSAPPSPDTIWAAAARTLTAYPSVIKSIQYGTVTLNTPVSIAPVNLAKAVLMNLGIDSVGGYSSINNSVSTGARLVFVNSTTINLVITGSIYPAIVSATANFVVVEFN